MFGSDMLETAIGLVFVYLTFSLICSGVREWISRLLNVRAKTLEKGIEHLLKDKDLVKQLFSHHMVGVKDIKGKAVSKGTQPTEISSKVFAEALLDSILKAESGDIPAVKKEKKADVIAEMKKAVNNLENFQVRKTLNDVIDNIEGDVEVLSKKLENAKVSVEKWYDNAMKQVSAWYKRQTQKVILGLAIIACIVFNVDTIMIVKNLSVNPDLRKSIVTAAVETPGDTAENKTGDNLEKGEVLRAQLDQAGLPLGWTKPTGKHLDPREVPDDVLGWIYKVLGLIISILAVSMGAPFWFDVLKKMINIRGAPKTQTSSSVPETAKK
jgi:hypothetical protein